MNLLKDKKASVSKSHSQKLNNKDVLHFGIAFKIFMKYIKFYKNQFIASFLISLVATAFNIIVIIGMGDLQSLFSKIIDNSTTLSLSSFLTFSGLLVLAYFLNSFFQWLMSMIVIRVSQGIGYKLRMDLFNHVQILSVQYFDTHESGNIMSVLTNDVSNLVIFISQNFTQTMYGLTTMIGMFILMFLISPYLSLIVIGTLIILLSLISIIIKKSGPAFIKQQKELGVMNGYIEETVSGQNIINLYNQQDNIQKDFEKTNKKLVSAGETSQGISGLLIP